MANSKILTHSNRSGLQFRPLVCRSSLSSLRFGNGGLVRLPLWSAAIYNAALVSTREAQTICSATSAQERGLAGGSGGPSKSLIPASKLAGSY